MTTDTQAALAERLEVMASNPLAVMQREWGELADDCREAARLLREDGERGSTGESSQVAPGGDRIPDDGGLASPARTVTAPDAADALAKIGRALDMISALCQTRGTPGAREWLMSIPADKERDPDLVIGAALRAARKVILAGAPGRDKEVAVESPSAEVRIAELEDWVRGVATSDLTIPTLIRLGARALVGLDRPQRCPDGWLREYERRKVALTEAVWGCAYAYYCGMPDEGRGDDLYRAEQALDEHVEALAGARHDPPLSAADEKEASGSIMDALGGEIRPDAEAERAFAAVRDKRTRPVTQSAPPLSTAAENDVREAVNPDWRARYTALLADHTAMMRQWMEEAMARDRGAAGSETMVERSLIHPVTVTTVTMDVDEYRELKRKAEMADGR